MRQKLFILDDHPMVISGIEKFLSATTNYKVVGTCFNPPDAVTQILKANPDILIFDYQLPGTTGLEIFNSLRPAMPSLKGVCYTQHTEGWIVMQVINAKVNGMVLKSEDPTVLANALDAVSHGKEFRSALVSQIVCDTYIHGQSYKLTNREIEVLKLIASGLSSKEIADDMHLSINTVEDYRKNLMVKLSAKNTADLVHKANKTGFI